MEQNDDHSIRKLNYVSHGHLYCQERDRYSLDVVILFVVFAEHGPYLVPDVACFRLVKFARLNFENLRV